MTSLDQQLQECYRVLADAPHIGRLAASAIFADEEDATGEEVEIAGWLRRRREALDAVDKVRSTIAKAAATAAGGE